MTFCNGVLNYTHLKVKFHDKMTKLKLKTFGDLSAKTDK